MSLGTLYVVAAPSGAGKTSLVDALVKSIDNIKISISYTTRPKRPLETEGVNYHFVSPAEFEKMIATKAFLEYANVFGNHYGTGKMWVEQQLQAGFDVILEIDWQGAQQIRQLFPQCVGIFILPPSLQILKQRLEVRNQDTEAIITKRLAEAKTEMSHYAEFDYLLVNDVFAETLADLQVIVQAQRLRQPRQSLRHNALIEGLLKS